MKQYVISVDNSADGIIVVGKIKRGRLTIKEIEPIPPLPLSMRNNYINEVVSSKKTQYKTDKVLKGRKIPVNMDFLFRIGIN